MFHKSTIAAGLIALSGSSALAADLPARTPPVSVIAPEPAFTWTGFYAGVNAGFATDRYTFPYAFGSAATGVWPGRGTIVSHGLIGGGQVGFNYQLPWNIVVGVDVEAEASGVTGHLPVNFPGIHGDIRTNVDLYGAFRAKVGYNFERFFFTDNVLVYLAMGGAFGSFRDRMYASVGPNPISYYQQTSRIAVSNAVGSLGIGVAHPFTRNLSAFVDYRYTALGPPRGAGRQVTVSTPFAAGTFGTRAMYHLVRVGVNYHFDLFR
jgi:outer membrane immunogenic protein